MSDQRIDQFDHEWEAFQHLLKESYLFASNQSPVDLVPDSVLFSSTKTSDGENSLAIRLGSDFLFSNLGEQELERLLEENEQGAVGSAASFKGRELGDESGQTVQDPGPLWNIVIPPDRKQAFYHVHGRSLLLCGNPGTYKTSFLHHLAREILTEQKNRCGREKSQKTWQLPLMLTGYEVLQDGLRESVTSRASQLCRKSFSADVVTGAIRCGYFVPLIDGIEEWAVDGCLSPSTRLLAEFLAMVGNTGRFACSVDSRFIRFGIFGEHAVTQLGERFQEPEKMALLELHPYGILEHVTDNPLESDFRTIHREQDACREWLQPDSGEEGGYLGKNVRRQILLDMARRMYGQQSRLLAYDDLQDIVFKTLPVAYRETFYLAKVIHALLTNDLFHGNLDRGIYFASQKAYEEALTLVFADAFLAPSTEDNDVEMLLAQGIMYDRLACLFWLHPGIEKKKEQIHSRIIQLFREIGQDPAVRHMNRRNLLWALLRLLFTYHRLFRNGREPVPCYSSISFRGEFLMERDLSHLILDQWDFSESDLTNSRFAGTELKNCSFNACLASTLTFHPQTLEGSTDFSGARLTAANLKLPRLAGVHLSHADLTAALLDIEKGEENDAEYLRSAILASTLIKINTKIFSLAEQNTLIQEEERLSVEIACQRWKPDTFFPGGCSKIAVTGKGDGVQQLSLHLPDLSRSSVDVLVPGGVRDIELLGRWHGGHLFMIFPDNELPQLFALIGNKTVFRKSCQGALLADDRLLVGTTEPDMQGLWLLSEAKLKLQGAQRVSWARPPERLFAIDSDTFLALEGNMLAKYRLEDSTIHTESILRLDGKPIHAVADRLDTMALVYPNGLVELISHQFGLYSRIRHQLSFADIASVLIAGEQQLLFVIGNWADTEPASAVAVLDGKTGGLLCYFPYEEELTPEKVDKIWKKNARVRFDREGSVRASEEDLCKGYIDGSQETCQELLKQIVTGDDLANQARDLPVTIKLPLQLRPDSPFGRLRPRYQLLHRPGSELPLGIEVTVLNPDGSQRQIAQQDIALQENDTGVELTFAVTFSQVGVHRLQVTGFLGKSSSRLKSLRRGADPAIRVTELNPFRFQAGLAGQHAYLFTGHRALIEQIYLGIQQNSSILGSRRQGKSSLLNNLFERLRERRRLPHVIPARLSFDSLAETGRPESIEFIERIFSSLYETVELRELCGLEQPYTFPSFSEAEKRLKALGARLQNMLGADARLVVLIDETDAHKDCKRTETDRIGTLFNSYAGWLSLVAFGLPAMFTGIDTTVSSGWIRFLYSRAYMQPLEDGELRAIVTKGVKGRFTVPEETMNHLCTYAVGRPHDLQVLMHEAVDQANHAETTVITPEMVDTALRDRLVPIYENYLEPLKTYEQKHAGDAASLRSNLASDFETTFTQLNSVRRADREAVYSFAHSWGFVKGRTGDTVHFPYALIKAWLATTA